MLVVQMGLKDLLVSNNYMLTSNRNFGVEIEFFCQDKTSLYRIGEKVHLVSDGSLRHIPFSSEYVSAILNGKSGVMEIHRVCELMKKNGASGDDPAMSVHIHLDGKKNTGELVISDTLPEKLPKSTVWSISNRLAKRMGKNEIERLVKDGQTRYDMSGVCKSTFSGIDYLSLAHISSKPTRHFKYYWYKRDDRSNWLKNVLYFYTQYSTVMEAIVSNSRKFGNMYCIPLGESYDLDEIEKCNTVQEIKELWYKGRSPNGHFDDSRYHNVNLHSFWDRHGTVEIRSHGGTIDPNKILLWVRLHQKIVDKLETMTVNDIKSNGNMYKNFMEFIEEPILQSYVKRLLGFYSGIIVK